MEYAELFDTVRSHLKRHRVSSTLLAGRPATPDSIAKAEAEMKIKLPPELRAFYETVGNGLVFSWKGPKGVTRLTGSLSIPDLSDLATMYLGLRDGVLYTADQADKYGFPYTKDAGLAKRTAARMWHWLPLIAEFNGDYISIDMGDPACPVIFDRHDWFDGGSGDNGAYLAPSLRDFMMGWGSVCFQYPKSLYWPACVRKEGGVNWGSDEFVEPFRIAGLAQHFR